MDTTKHPCRARYSSICPCCDRGIQRGMPILVVPPLKWWGNDLTWRRSVAIHAGCERLYDLEAS